MTEIGPHLLGRKDFIPDERDYRASNFRDIGVRNLADTINASELAKLAAAEFAKTTITFKQWAARHYDDPTVAHWWRGFNYLAQIVPSPPAPPTGDVKWESNIVLDQGDTGHCVGFGCAGWGITAPVEDVYDNQDGDDIYYEAKVIEGDPRGEDGAYCRDGAKAMVQRKRMTAYAFVDTEADILDWLRNKGPLIVGTDWTDDMFNPDASGVIEPTGSVEGGHCYGLIGISGNYFYCKQSWGDWALNGYFKMLISDWMDLYQDGGEAIAAIELPIT